MLIIDHKTNLPRVRTLAKLLAQWNVVSAEQLYGSSEPEEPVEITARRREQIRKVIEGQDLILLHAGDNQHLVREVLKDPMLDEISCLIYSGGTFPSDIRVMLRESGQEGHCELPVVLSENIGDTWLTSDSASNVSACVTKIKDGAKPRAAVDAVFGDPELENILARLFDRLSENNGSLSGEALQALKNERDELFGAYYKRKRGW